MVLLVRRLLSQQHLLGRCQSLSSVPQAGPDRILPAEDHRAWEPEAAVKLRLAESGPGAIQPISIPTLFRQQVEAIPNKKALQALGRQGEDIHWTWTQYHEEVSAAAKGFIELGLEPFHTVTILGHNDPSWHISALAAIHAGGFGCGIYQTNGPAACQYIAEDSKANIMVVGDLDQLQKVLEIRSSLPNLRAIVVYGEEVTKRKEGVFSWSELIRLGNSTSDTIINARLTNIAINQCSNVCYTSGTTGNPKGTMLSHDSITYTARHNMNSLGWRHGEESVVSYLPLSHVAGLMMDIYMPIAAGATCCFADRNALKGTLLENLRRYRPTRFVGVPRVFEKIEEGMRLAAVKSGVKKKVGDWAKAQALAHHKAEEAGKAHTSIGYRLANKIVLSKVHDALGFDRVQPFGFYIGGATVSPETVKYFLSLDMKLLEGTGMTETSASLQIANTVEPGNFRIGRVGKAQNHTQIKLKNKDKTGMGELLSRGRGNCMGYLNKREKTLEALDDNGWLHSGDLVREDDEGFFKLVGRIKEILITAGGENVAPTNIEEEIKKEVQEVVGNVVVVGDKQKYLTCLITLKVTVDPVSLLPTNILDPRAIAWIASLGGGHMLTIQELLASPSWSVVEAAIQAGLERANTRAISNVAKVKRFTVLPKEFSVDGGEFGPSLKLRRFLVVDMYKDVIDQMYAED